jgi:site-specific DNA recombinase
MAGKALGYVRVSTQEQATEGHGLAVQRKAIRDHCRRNGVRLVDILGDEGLSGSNGLDDRHGLAEALARIEGGEAQQLVVYRYDRLARDLRLQLTITNALEQKGAAVVSVCEPEVDGPDELRELVRNLLGSIAQYERAVIRGRMLAGKQAKASKGGYTGGRPGYGKRAEGRELVDDSDEREVVATIKRLRSEGHSYRLICAELEEAGLDTRGGGPWQPAVIRRIAQR